MKVKTQVKAGQLIVIGNSTTEAPIDNRGGGAGILNIGNTYNA
jgi:hypothetical protein